jgi:hypothetical protein
LGCTDRKGDRNSARSYRWQQFQIQTVT